jgi:hypothetical protein
MSAAVDADVNPARNMTDKQSCLHKKQILVKHKMHQKNTRSLPTKSEFSAGTIL